MNTKTLGAIVADHLKAGATPGAGEIANAISRRLPGAVVTYPRIVRFTGTHDSGEFGNATCSHCGALGRYETSFVTDNGKHGAAMAGCIKLFPVAQIAREELRLTEKAKKYEKQGWHLNRLDADALEALEAFYRDEVTEAHAMAKVNFAKRWNAARFRR